jgi:hypothetical protein
MFKDFLLADLFLPSLLQGVRCLPSDVGKCNPKRSGKMTNFFSIALSMLFAAGLTVGAQAQSKKDNPGLPVCQNFGFNQVGYKCFRKSDGKVCTMLGAFAGKGQWDCK